jgi:hypothetical protein
MRSKYKKLFFAILPGIIVAGLIFSTSTLIKYFSSNSQNEEDPWLSGWSYRRPVTITNTTSDLTDYQVLITLNTQTLISQGKASSTCADLRFTDSDGETLLNYWIESDCNTTSTKIWVKVPSIPASSTKTIYVYYGNSSATSQSNGDNTFLFFDHFEGTSLNLNKWTGDTGSASVSNSVVTLTGSSVGQNIWQNSVNYPYFSYPIAIRIYGYLASNQYNGFGLREVNLGNDLVFFYGNYTYGPYIRQDRNGSSTNVSSNWTRNAWATFEIFWQPTQCAYYCNGTQVSGSPLTTNVPLDNLGAWLYTGNSSTYQTKVDWILVRKYTSPEPTTSVGEEETLINVSGYAYEEDGTTPWSGCDGVTKNIALVISTLYYRRPITITNTTSSLTDHQVLVTLDTQSLISAGKMRTDCGDIRFTDSDGTTSLNYWLESGCNTTSTTIWVKVPSIPASSTKTIYVYYGNPSATSQSNGDNTFDFFDDFEDGVIDSSKWVIAYGSITESSGMLHMVGNAGEKWLTNTGGAVIRSTNTWSGNYIAEAQVNITATAGFQRIGVTWYVSDAYYATSKRRWTTTNSVWTQHFAVEAANATQRDTNVNVDINPVWVRLDKVGDTYKGYYSSDGVTWTLVNSYTYAIGTPYFALECEASGTNKGNGYVLIARVRKYTSPEPTTSVGEEENAGAIPFVTATTTCSTLTGAFTFSEIVIHTIPASPMVIYFKGVSGNYGSNVNRYSGSGNVSGIVVRKNAAILQHDDSGPITNADLNSWDNDNDPDVNYVVNNGNLTVESGSKLIINTNDTFTPDGTVTVNGDLIVMSGATLNGTSNVTVKGGYATGEGTINLTGGTFTLDGAGYFGGNSNWTFYNLTFGGDSNVETTVATGTGEITVSNVLTIGQNQTLNAGSKKWNLLGTGTPFVINGNFNASNSTFTYIGQSSWLSGWSYRKPVTISNSASSLTDYQVLVTLDTQSLISNQKMRSDCGDIRFTDSDSQTLLNYWLESGCNTTSTTIWVKVPSISASSTATIYVYYGNPNATNASNGGGTFDFFDDFDSADSKWVNTGTGGTKTWTTLGGKTVIKLDGPASGGNSYKVVYNRPLSLSNGLVVDISLRAATDVGGGLAVSTSLPSGYKSGWYGGNLFGSGNTLFNVIYNGSSVDVSKSFTANYWYKLEDIITPSSVKSKVYDGENVVVSGEKTGITVPSTLYPIIEVYDIGYFDWILVRKYTSPEPTTSVGGEELLSFINISAATYNNLEILSQIDGFTFILGTGTGQTIVTNGYLTIGNGTNTVTTTADTYDPILDINGDFTISSNATFIASNISSAYFAKNWTNNGTFVHSTGTIVFDGSNASTFSGATTFYNLTCTTPSKNLIFPSGVTQTIEGSLVLDGQSCSSPIVLKSSSPDTQWKINIVSIGSANVSHVDVKDSNAIGDKIVAYHSIDSGNNTNWTIIYPCEFPPILKGGIRIKGGTRLK